MTVLLLLGMQALSNEGAGHANTRARTYVQGASVKIWVDVLDTATRLPVTALDDVRAIIASPDGLFDTRLLSDGQIDTEPAGRYSCVVDTTVPGQWIYQFTTSGDDVTVAKARFHVREGLVVTVPVP